MPTLPQPKPEEPEPTEHANPELIFTYQSKVWVPEVEEGSPRKVKFLILAAVYCLVTVGMALAFGFDVIPNKGIWLALFSAVAGIASVGSAVATTFKIRGSRSRAVATPIAWRDLLSVSRFPAGKYVVSENERGQSQALLALLRYLNYKTSPDRPPLNLQDVADSSEAPAAAQAVTRGLNDLFSRLGPPPPGLSQEAEFEPSAGGSGGRNG